MKRPGVIPGLLAGLAINVCSAATPPNDVQVLLQGDDAGALRAALGASGGTLTHELPLIGGIGGRLPTANLEALATHPAVTNIVEDFNPTEPPEPRDCNLAGDLQVRLERSQLRWRVHNFSEFPLRITGLEVSWPQHLGAINAIRLGGEDVLTEALADSRAASLDLDQPLEPGAHLLEVDFEHPVAGSNQNDFALTVALADCSAELLPAYPDNAGDYYYSRVIGADRLHAQGITGVGVGIAVVDSGLWETSALTLNTQGESKIPVRFDAIANTTVASMTDESGHGSHMTSIIAHNQPAAGPPGPSFRGVAPDASIIPVKVFGADGSGDFLDIIRGIQWVIANRDRYNIRVLNLSLAAVPRFHYWDDPINQAVLRAWQAGIVVVAAAGNEGPGWSTVGSPGNNPYVITVGAVTDSWTHADRNDDYIPDFSSRGPTNTGHLKPDVVAPGGHMTGLVPPQSTLARENPNYFLASGEYVSTGSSQAAAVVSGMIALLLQVDPTLGNDDVKCMLTTSAEPAINRDGRLAYSPFVQGSGYLTVTRAITLGQRGCGNAGMDIDAAVAGSERLYGPAEADTDGEPTLPGLNNMLADSDPAKGPSDTRRWGVKAHVERLAPDGSEPTQIESVTVDWAQIYEEERQAIKRLRQQP